MIVGIHQPNYLPYMGFFDKLRNSDIFIIYDDAQFNKSDFQHRNKIRIYHGSKWLTVPVEKKHIAINKIQIKNDLKINNMLWTDAHLKEITDNYSSAPYFKKFESSLDDIYSETYDSLIDINIKLIDFLRDAFRIKTKIVYSSDFNLSSKSTEKIVELVNAVGGDTYLSGPAGKDYMDVDMFDKCDIKLEYQNFSHPVYKQQYEGFIPYMSALDALLNVGSMVD